MPTIQWSGLPPALRDHLLERLRERKITIESLTAAHAFTGGRGFTARHVR